MKLVGSHGSSSMLFVMNVKVWHFLSNSHKVMTALIVIVPSKVLFWSFLCNPIDMICSALYSSVLDKVSGSPSIWLMLGQLGSWNGSKLLARLLQLIDSDEGSCWSFLFPVFLHPCSPFYCPWVWLVFQ
jgi:hypothetical protein